MFELFTEEVGISVLIGTSFVSISGFLGRYLSKRLIEGYKADSLKDIEKIKANYQEKLKILDDKFKLKLLKVENQLQISKSTYELLFDKKINVYKDLVELRYQYFRYKNESALSEEDPLDAIETYYSYFIRCKNLIESNILYISPKLSIRYESWMNAASEHFKQESVDGFQVHGQTFSEQENAMNVHDAQFSARNSLVNDTQELMEKIFEQVNLDLGIIRSVSNRPLESNQ